MKKYNLTQSQIGVLYDFDNNGKVVLTNKNYIWGHLKINQKVDIDRLKKAINFCFKNNDSIRIKLCKEEDKLLQYFEKYEEQNIKVIEVNTEDDVKKLENEIINTPFDMFNSFLFKVIIYKYKNGFGGIILKLNHVIADGYTMGLILYEVLGYYSKKINLFFPVSYLNYINSEKRYPNSWKYKKDKKYWNKIFKIRVPDIAYIPSNKKNFSLSKANKLIFNIDNDIVNIVKEYCQKNNISICTFYMSVFAIYIYKRTELSNFFLSTANRNRRTIKEKLTAGMSTKVAYFIVEIQNNKFVDFTKKMKISLKSSYKHINYINNYTKELFGQYNDNRTLPTNVFLSYQDLQINTDKMNINFDITGDNNVGTYGSDIVSIHIFEYRSNVKIIYDYLSDKYSKDEIESINNSVISIIKQVSQDNRINIQDIKI